MSGWLYFMGAILFLAGTISFVIWDGWFRARAPMRESVTAPCTPRHHAFSCRYGHMPCGRKPAAGKEPAPAEPDSWRTVEDDILRRDHDLAVKRVVLDAWSGVKRES